MQLCHEVISHGFLLSVTGVQEAQRPTSPKRWGWGRRGKGIIVNKEKNTDNDLGRKVNLLIIIAEI